jgi:hypothetical protein
MPGEIGRGRAASHPRHADRTPDQRLAAYRADAYCEVEAFVDEIDHAIG